MSKSGMSRRQFLGGAAVVAAASTVPVFSNLAPAMAAQPAAAMFPVVPATAFADWSTKFPTGLDATAAARNAWEIYRGRLRDGGTATGQGC